MGLLGGLARVSGLNMLLKQVRFISDPLKGRRKKAHARDRANRRRIIEENRQKEATRLARVFKVRRPSGALSSRTALTTRSSLGNQGDL